MKPIKTIKRTEQMRLDELIKYILDNDIKSEAFSSDINIEPIRNHKNKVYVHANGSIQFGLSGDNIFSSNDTYTIENEELITKDTVFDELMCVHKGETLIKAYESSINGIFKTNFGDEINEVHALIGGRLELVWERTDDQ